MQVVEVLSSLGLKPEAWVTMGCLQEAIEHSHLLQSAAEPFENCSLLEKRKIQYIQQAK